MEKEWIGVIGTLAGVLAGFALNSIVVLLLNRKKLQRDQYYLAILVIANLDRFFDNAILRCSDSGRENYRDNCYYFSTDKPEFDVPQLDVDWRCLPPALMKDILWFPHEIKSADAFIKSVHEEELDPPYFTNMFKTTHYEYAILALKANKLSNKLRLLAKLPKRDLAHDNIDRLAFLQKLVIEANKRTR